MNRENSNKHSVVIFTVIHRYWLIFADISSPSTALFRLANSLSFLLFDTRRNQDPLATKEHRDHKGSGQQASVYAFLAFSCGKGLFLAGPREFRAVASRDLPRPVAPKLGAGGSARCRAPLSAAAFGEGGFPTANFQRTGAGAPHEFHTSTVCWECKCKIRKSAREFLAVFSGTKCPLPPCLRGVVPAGTQSPGDFPAGMQSRPSLT